MVGLKEGECDDGCNEIASKIVGVKGTADKGNEGFPVGSKFGHLVGLIDRGMEETELKSEGRKDGNDTDSVEVGRSVECDDGSLKDGKVVEKLGRPVRDTRVEGVKLG